MSKPEPSLFDEFDAEGDARALDEAEAAYAAGRTISHETMTRWLDSWGTAEELPPPSVGE